MSLWIDRFDRRGKEVIDPEGCFYPCCSLLTASLGILMPSRDLGRVAAGLIGSGKRLVWFESSIAA